MNSRIQAFQEFLATQSLQIPVWGFIINLLLAALLAFVLSQVYIRFGESLSNRRQFAANFILLAMTTTLVISIIKTSLALSLGLVGALSIVRFRAAIKEPEELTYLFLNIAIGLGLGAGQRLITVVAFAIILVVIWVKRQSKSKAENQNLYLTVASENQAKANLEQITDVLKRECAAVNLKRFDEAKDMLEASFLVEFNNFDDLAKTKASLKSLDDSLRITFFDNDGII